MGALFTLGFPTAPCLRHLTLRDAAQLAGSFSKRHAVTREAAFAASTVLRLLVSIGFQVLFTSLEGILFIIRSRYFCAIGRQLVLSLGRWSSLIHAGFLVSDATRGSADCRRPFPLQGYHLLWPGFPVPFA